MRFSLVLAFSLLTISCFAAWIYQLNDQVTRIEESNAALNQEIAGFDDHLERDVGLLKLAYNHNDSPKAKMLDRLEEHFKGKIEELRLPKDFESENLTIRTIYSLEPRDLTNRSPLVF